MQILYNSTRGLENNVPASQAILKGLASDGGLFVPQQIPRLDVDPEILKGLSYKELAFEIMKRFLTDYTEEELKYCIDHAYDDKFEVPEAAAMHDCGNACFLELYHGATIAFKDMALSILPYLMTTAAKKNNMSNEIVILTATSGDTGKAALAGFADVPGIRIIVFYPKDGVSRVQEKQMITQKGDNTCVIAIRGNFDDAQTGVKKMFNDKELQKELAEAGFEFSSANSINIGRLVPQIVYYVWAYYQMVNMGKVASGEKINIVVPTGNFGNILAAYYAYRMGLPVNRLICASNENKVLFDFFETGIYDKNREFILTSSPSMDILVSSNLERLIFETTGYDADKSSAYMAALRTGGKYEITPEMKEKMSIFVGGTADESETAAVIRKYFTEKNYILDPHTAVGAAVYEKYVEQMEDRTPAVIASTASPYKFARSVLTAIDRKYDEHDDMTLFSDLNSLSKMPMPKAITELFDAPVRHNTVIDIEDMKKTVKESLMKG